MFRCRTASGLAAFFSLLVIASGFFLGPPTAHAQVGAYATVTGERLTGFTCSDPQGQCASSGGVARPYGSAFGAYYDFRSMGLFRLGVDLRGSVLNSNKSATNSMASTDLVRHYSALGGLRAEARTPFKWLHPYGEIAAGLGRSNAAEISFNPRTYQNFTQVEGFVGADISIAPFLDIRAIELGGGEMFGPSSHSIQSIGIGVVFHTPRP